MRRFRNFAQLKTNILDKEESLNIAGVQYMYTFQNNC